MDPGRAPCMYQNFNVTNGEGVNKRESARMTSRLKRRQWDLGRESSLDCSSSSSDTDGELSKLREENRKLRKLAKHYRRKYLNIKERFREVSSLNVELQKRLFEVNPLQHSFETPPSSMTYPIGQQHQRQHYVMNPMMQQPAQREENRPMESPPTYDGNGDSDPEVVEIHENDAFVNCFPGQEPICELSLNGGGSREQFLSEEKFRNATGYVQGGEAGDSLFVKNLAIAIWGKETLATRSVTGRRCMAIMHSKPKPPLSPNKLNYIKEKLIERVRLSEPHISMLDLGRRVSKINGYIANKINHLSRKPLDGIQASPSEQPSQLGDLSQTESTG